MRGQFQTKLPVWLFEFLYSSSFISLNQSPVWQLFYLAEEFFNDIWYAPLLSISVKNDPIFKLKSTVISSN